MAVLSRRVRPDDWKPVGVEALEANALKVVCSTDNRSVIAGPGAGKTQQSKLLSQAPHVAAAVSVLSVGVQLKGPVPPRSQKEQNDVRRALGEVRKKIMQVRGLVACHYPTHTRAHPALVPRRVPP